MLTLIVCVLGFIVLSVAVDAGEWGVFWTFAVICGVLLIGLMAGREETRARANWRRYWAEGGPRGDRKR